MIEKAKAVVEEVKMMVIETEEIQGMKSQGEEGVAEVAVENV